MIYNENCIDGMKQLEPDSVDLIVTDPPYGMSFMGKNWDKALPDPEAFEQMLRVLKPGAFAFVMCAPRSDLQARMSILLEDAGFDIAFTPIYWTFATGFPKAQNISKQIDKRAGVKRKVIGVKKHINHLERGDSNINEQIQKASGSPFVNDKLDKKANLVTEPHTPEAQKYNGAYAGFQPKPAVEVVIVAMKPRTKKTYVDQCLSNGHGITWLDDCRIPFESDNIDTRRNSKGGDNGINGSSTFKIRDRKVEDFPKQEGRFPANLLVSDESLTESHSRYFDLDAWFAIIPKPSKKEKNEGTENNNHPTVKPIKLMSYLITLGSRPGQIVLDPFMGSGTTGISTKLLGRKFIGYEMEQEYFNIAEARIDAWKTRTVRSHQER